MPANRVDMAVPLLPSRWERRDAKEEFITHTELKTTEPATCDKFSPRRGALAGR